MSARPAAGARAAGAVGVTVAGARKWYGPVQAVAGVDLAAAPGEMVCLLGPSGCGKTTTLRMIAGLEMPDDGTIHIGDRDVTHAPPWKRRIGMVFQNYALFPHMTVAENVAFGLEMQGLRKSECRRRADAALVQVRLGDYAARRPSQLSGGQRQRVALARAIVTEPDVLLFDEPLAALDRKLREQMQVEIKELQRRVGITTLFVTHDQEEALALSDRIVVMEAGTIVQTGTPTEIYDRPASRFVSDFIGVTNALSGSVEAIESGTALVRLASGDTVHAPAAELRPGQPVDLVIRPERVSITDTAVPGRTGLAATITNIVYIGAVTYYHAEVAPGAVLIAMAPNDAGAMGGAAPGQRVVLGWEPGSLLVFPGQGSAARR